MKSMDFTPLMFHVYLLMIGYCFGGLRGLGISASVALVICGVAMTKK